MRSVAISLEKLDVAAITDLVRNHGAGAISVFLGTTRNNFTVHGVNKKVLRLEYEAYVGMAEKELHSLIDKATAKWADLTSVAISHRIGVVPIGEESVVIAVSSPHRRDALDATTFLIDELKRTVPIWKKEFYEDGTSALWKTNCC
ncbi:Molybdopterin synthase catalytic subunit [Irineochytrium annulatum]|nr:Molybdopterin synthase catalytic subunit [Irineochytrium annulatum]